MPSARQTVIVTGAAGNLGRAVARHFAAQGAQLVLVDRRREDIDSAFGAADASRLHVQADLLDAAQAQAAARAAQQQFGGIDVLCNLAGGFRMGTPVHATPDADWDFLFDLNARSVLHMARAVVPLMLQAGRGAIVNVGAFAAGRGVAQMGAYTASKSAVARLTEAMAGELREQGIQVNCVLPTILDTPENRAAMPEADPARWVAPADLAQVIGFLASDAARAVHGACVPVTGLS